MPESDLALNIHIAATDDDILATFSVMRQLRPHLEVGDYVPTVRAMQISGGYRLARLKVDGEVRAVAGFRLTRSLAWGRFAYVDDLVTDSMHRSRGHGSALLGWIGKFARQAGCTELHLDSGVQRTEAHRFYWREAMYISCHHFHLQL